MFMLLLDTMVQEQENIDGGQDRGNQFPLVYLMNLLLSWVDIQTFP